MADARMSDLVHDDDTDHTWTVDAAAVNDLEEARVIFSALDSFRQYGKVAHFNLTHLRRQSFYALPQAHWAMLAEPPFSYLETLDRVDDAIESNAEVARLILESGILAFRSVARSPGQESVLPEEWVGVAKHQDIDKARSTLRQLFRDWTAEGARERDVCYTPTVKALEAEKPRHPDGYSLKVLVPGAGLGRLVFDLCLKGFDVEGNELSYHQLMASSYILNCTQRAEQHTIFPWIHTFSNHRIRENHLRGYKMPDIHPGETLRSASSFGSMSMSAADFLCLYSDDEHREMFDAVACVFFLDTAPNLIRYLDTMFHTLKPGGVLVNFGPLLWHFEDNAPGNHGRDDDGDGEHDANNSSGIADPGSFELADDEVRALVERMGFVVEAWETGIEAPYIHDTQSMLRTTFMSSSWVARKPEALGKAGESAFTGGFVGSSLL